MGLTRSDNFSKGGGVNFSCIKGVGLYEGEVKFKRGLAQDKHRTAKIRRLTSKIAKIVFVSNGTKATVNAVDGYDLPIDCRLYPPSIVVI